MSYKDRHGYNFMWGRSTSELIIMYETAKADHIKHILANEQEKAEQCKQTAIDCAVTLHAITGGHEI